MNKKIVLIGSGSQFTEFYLQELFKFSEFKGITLAFVDRNPERLAVVKGIADKINGILDAGINFEGYTDRREALPGASIVYCFASVNNKESWAYEKVICERHGLRVYEFHTSSVSSLSMGMRNIPLVLDLCADMEELCPDAWLICDNNPLTKIVTAVMRHTNTKVVGYCNGHELVEMAVEQILGKTQEGKSTEDTAEAGLVDREYMVPGGAVSIQAAGINHLTWIKTIRDSKTGEDLYPKFRKIIEESPLEKIPQGFRYSAEVFKRLGYFPGPGDTHIADYLWCTDEEIAKKTSIEAFEVALWFGGRDANAWSDIAARVQDRQSVEEFILERRTGWQSTQMARIMLGGKYEYFPAINVMNNGRISNLPDDVVVEVPGVLGPDSVQGLKMGRLPEEIAGFCHLHAMQSNLFADAAATGDRDKALKGLMIDPYIAGITKAEAMLEDVIQSNSKYDIRFK